MRTSTMAGELGQTDEARELSDGDFEWSTAWRPLRSRGVDAIFRPQPHGVIAINPLRPAFRKPVGCQGAVGSALDR